MESKIPGSESACQNTLAKSNDEVHHPKPTEEMINSHTIQMSVDEITIIPHLICWATQFNLFSSNAHGVIRGGGGGGEEELRSAPGPRYYLTV